VTEPDRFAKMRNAARSPSWEVRAAAGQHLALLAGDLQVDRTLATLLLDEHDTAVTYETSAALLRGGDAHAFRLVLVALGEADGDYADEIMGAAFHVYGHEALLWETAWQRCEALGNDPDERVRRGAASILPLSRPDAA
jgi:hypothetical protein